MINKKGTIIELIFIIIMFFLITIVGFLYYENNETYKNDLNDFCEEHGYENYTFNPLGKYSCFNIDNGYMTKVTVSLINGEFYIENE